MIHPDTELRFISDEIGWGVFVTRRIPRGTITWARDPLDQVLEPQWVERLPSIYKRMLEKYAYVNRRGRWILCWDHARWVNHSCDATCLSPGYEFEIAVRDLEPGDEFTDEYGTLNIHESFECRCGRANCRGTVHPDDVVRLHERWDALIRGAFPEIRSVDQPLWQFVARADRKNIDEALADPGRLSSTITHYYDLAKARKRPSHGKDRRRRGSR